MQEKVLLFNKDIFLPTGERLTKTHYLIYDVIVKEAFASPDIDWSNKRCVINSIIKATTNSLLIFGTVNPGAEVIYTRETHDTIS